MNPLAMPNPGIMAWISSIRATMANDPGIQLLEHQIQSNGLAFLEDYLDSIMMGPVQDPIIELVKTPARKKDASKKTRTAATGTNKLKAVISSNLNDEGDKENDFPAGGSAPKYAQVNRTKSTSFRYPLDQSRVIFISDAEADLILTDNEDEPNGKVHERQTTPPHLEGTPAPKDQTDPLGSIPTRTILTKNIEVADELSIVIEDEEFPDAERNQDKIELTGAVDVLGVGSMPCARDEQHISQQEPSVYPKSVDAITPGSPLHKPSLKHFPTIGAPSPFRKSMRALKEPLAAETRKVPPKQPPSSRTSWLIRARGPKATEDQSAKKTAPVQAVIPDTPRATCGSKRKSGEMLDTIQCSSNIPDEPSRPKKSTKNMEEPDTPSRQDDNQTRGLDQLHTHVEVECSVGGIQHSPVDNASEHLITRLKRAVEGYSARSGRSTGKSLGGAAVSALADALAAAEAKIAERHAAEGRSLPSAISELPAAPIEEPKCPSSIPIVSEIAESSQSTPEPSNVNDKLLGVSDLVSKAHLEHGPVFFRPPVIQSNPQLLERTGDISKTQMNVSTTPPNSPPPSQPGMSKVLENGIPRTAPIFFPPRSPIFTRFEPQVPPRDPHTLSVQPTFVPTQSTVLDSIFDNEVAPWLSTTQSAKFDDLVQSQRIGRESIDTSTDESWHLGDGEAWGPIICMKDDSMTWSTAPTRSIAGTSNDSSARLNDRPNSMDQAPEKRPILGSEPSENHPHSEDEGNMDIDELDENIPSIRLVTKPATIPIPEDPVEPQTATSSANSAINITSKLSSILGVNRKGKEPLRSIQLAAAAAKKQQEEVEKRAARLKDFEARRQQVLQKKIEEEKNRERRLKEDVDRWKREKDKEDQAEKRPFRQPVKKLDDDKKRLPSEMDKIDIKSTSKDKLLLTSKPAKLPVNLSQSTLNPPQSASKTTKFTQGLAIPPKGTGTKALSTAPKNTEKGKEKEKGKGINIEDRQLSKVVHANQQARIDTQLEDSRKTETHITSLPSEMIELPEINSEYSDSDDDKSRKKKTREYPQWTQSSEFTAALQEQSALNPDDIFGAMKPLEMEEIFKHRAHRFRARTSSAVWEGTDELTVAEEKEYARRMGYAK